jgi:hypothetical protein
MELSSENLILDLGNLAGTDLNLQDEDNLYQTTLSNTRILL